MNEQRLERVLRQGPPFATRYVPSCVGTRRTTGRVPSRQRGPAGADHGGDGTAPCWHAGGAGRGGGLPGRSSAPSRMGGWHSSAAARAHKAPTGGQSATSTSFGRVRPRIGSSGRTPRSWIRSVPCSRPTGGDSPTARPTGPCDTGYQGAALVISDIDAAGNASESLRIDVGGTHPAAVRRLVGRRSPRRVRRPADRLQATPIDPQREVRSGSQRSQTATWTCCRTYWPPTWSGRLTAPSSPSRAARPIWSPGSRCATGPSASTTRTAAICGSLSDRRESRR